MQFIRPVDTRGAHNCQHEQYFFLCCRMSSSHKKSYLLHKYRAINLAIVADSCLCAWWCAILKVRYHRLSGKNTVDDTNDSAALQQQILIVVLSHSVLVIYLTCFLLVFAIILEGSFGSVCIPVSFIL